jgi:hypothetical protein
MSLALVAVLIIVGFVGVAALAVGIPLVAGLLAWDIADSRKSAPAVRTHSSGRIAAERGVARGFVVAGGLFWSVASFAGLYSFQETGVGNALMGAFIPLAAVLATLVVGWYYERVTAALLAAASLIVVAWGVVYQFELGVWMIMVFALIGPMLTASALFWMARRDQDAYERATATRPELSPVFAARSSIQ